MTESSERKIKLLLLYEILRKQTDERHPMTTGELSDALLNSGIAVSRKTLYEDIETLNRYGFEILCDKSRSNRYYVADLKFERPEIQILLQAIGAAKFLTEKKSSALSHKIAELLGESQAKDEREVPDAAADHARISAGIPGAFKGAEICNDTQKGGKDRR